MLMTQAENFEEQTLERQRLALVDAMFGGDPEPYVGTWSRRNPVSLFGAWGPCKAGWPELSKTFRWVGDRHRALARPARPGTRPALPAMRSPMGTVLRTVRFPPGDTVRAARGLPQGAPDREGFRSAALS